MNVMSSPLFSFLGKKISRGRHPLLRRHRAGESIIRENMRVCTGGTVGYDIFFPIATSCIQQIQSETDVLGLTLTHHAWEK